MIDLTKRQKIIIASSLTTMGLISTQLVDFNLRFYFLLALAGVAYLLSLWALWTGLNFTKAVVILILPTLYTLAVASFYFLLPVRWLTRLPVATFFGSTFYLLLLSQNVFNVAAIRTIPLYRAASTAAFLFTLITAFLIFNVVHAFNLLFIWNGGVIFLISLPLSLQVLWSIEMEDKISLANFFQAFVVSLCLGQLGIALSFWPMSATIWSLTLSSGMYVFLGMLTQSLRNRLSRRVEVEYWLVGGVVLLVSFLTTSWTG